ncbi:MAG: hypothetical protein KAR20_01715 [Candidatus Heimdallarchaeota archaeon]|nr:hypothetical protein [Candidatus Heimdallarchaeota archaeon]
MRKVEKETVETDIVLGPESDWFSQTGLKVKSVLKFHKLVTTEREFIRQKLGEIPEFMLKDDFFLPLLLREGRGEGSNLE